MKLSRWFPIFLLAPFVPCVFAMGTVFSVSFIISASIECSIQPLKRYNCVCIHCSFTFGSIFTRNCRTSYNFVDHHATVFLWPLYTSIITANYFVLGTLYSSYFRMVFLWIVHFHEKLRVCMGDFFKFKPMYLRIFKVDINPSHFFMSAYKVVH